MRKPSVRLIFVLLHGAFCFLTLRYFVSVFSAAIRDSCMRMEPSGEGGYAFVFYPELLGEVLPAFLPAILLHALMLGLAIAACIMGICRMLTSRRGLICYSVIGAGAAAEAVAVLLLENGLFGAESAGYRKLLLACYMEARYYSPFGLLGDDGINLVFLTSGTGFQAVKYLYLAVIFLLSLGLAVAFGLSRRTETGLPD